MKIIRQFRVTEKNTRSDGGVTVRTIKLREDDCGLVDPYNNVIELIVSKKEFNQIKVNYFFTVSLDRC